MDASTPSATEDTSSTSDAVMADDNITSSSTAGKTSPVNQIAITGQMFEHLSFLLTTTTDAAVTFRPKSSVVPVWTNAATDEASVPLDELTNIVTMDLTRIPSQEAIEGVIDITDISNLIALTFQITISNIKHHHDARMSQMTIVINCHSTNIHTNLSRLQGRKSFFLVSEIVIKF